MENCEKNFHSIFDYIESKQENPVVFAFKRMPKKFIPSAEIQILDFFATMQSNKYNKEFNYRLIFTSKALYKYSKHNSKMIKSQLLLRNPRIFKLEETLITGTGEEQRINLAKKKCGIRLKGYNGLITFYLADQTLQNKIYYEMCSVCVQLQISKNYVQGKLLGKGNYAKVTIGFHNKNYKQFAIKAIGKEKSMQNPRTINSLINEIDVMRQLDHENIIKLYDVYEGEKSVYLVLDYVQGGELFTFIKSKKSYCEETARKIMYGVLSGLAHCHSKHIAHRDLKPENLILVDSSDNYVIKIGDFGLSTFILPGTTNKQKCGSPGYVAPEVFDDEGYTCQADIFSAGVILFILLTGFSPFYGKSCKEVMLKNIECNPDYQSEIWNSVSKEGLDLTKQMLKKAPKDRITADVALKHPWFKKEFEEMCELNDALVNMNKYKNTVRITLSKMKEDEKICTRTPLMIGNNGQGELQEVFTPRKKGDISRAESKKSSLLVKTLDKEFQSSVSKKVIRMSVSPNKKLPFLKVNNDTANSYQAAFIRYMHKENDEEKNSGNLDDPYTIPDEHEPIIQINNKVKYCSTYNNNNNSNINSIPIVKISKRTKKELDRGLPKRAEIQEPEKVEKDYSKTIKEQVENLLNENRENRKSSQNIEPFTSNNPTLIMNQLVRPKITLN